MGQSIVGLLLGFMIVFGVTFWARTCLPNPGGSGVEWLHREDAIIVQMKVVGGFDVTGSGSGGFVTADTPDITLYGDGILLVKDEEEPTRFIQTTVSSGTMRNLLAFVEDQGFFGFDYEQPEAFVSDQSTTYIYANTKLAANAVKAYALSDHTDDGTEWDQVRRLSKIARRIKGMAGAARGTAGARDYSYDAVVLGVQKISRNTSLPDLSLKEWPFPDIDLTAMVGDGIFGERQLSGDQADRIVETLAASQLFSQGRSWFVVHYRPVLPYEENFPEFEPPLSTDEQRING
jgi:hypothetical protein